MTVSPTVDSDVSKPTSESTPATVPRSLKIPPRPVSEWIEKGVPQGERSTAVVVAVSRMRLRWWISILR
jgi:hypothetical protein